jgi:hypothetical protein
LKLCLSYSRLTISRTGKRGRPAGLTPPPPPRFSQQLIRTGQEKGSQFGSLFSFKGRHLGTHPQSAHQPSRWHKASTEVD